MTDNLAEQLRGWVDTDEMSDDARRQVFLMSKAADEIERLRAAIAPFLTEGVGWRDEALRLRAEIARKDAALREIERLGDFPWKNIARAALKD